MEQPARREPADVHRRSVGRRRRAAPPTRCRTPPPRRRSARRPNATRRRHAARDRAPRAVPSTRGRGRARRRAGSRARARPRSPTASSAARRSCAQLLDRRGGRDVRHARDPGRAADRASCATTPSWRSRFEFEEPLPHARSPTGRSGTQVNCGDRLPPAGRRLRPHPDLELPALRRRAEARARARDRLHDGLQAVAVRAAHQPASSPRSSPRPICRPASSTSSPGSRARSPRRSSRPAHRQGELHRQRRAPASGSWRRRRRR